MTYNVFSGTLNPTHLTSVVFGLPLKFFWWQKAWTVHDGVFVQRRWWRRPGCQNVPAKSKQPTEETECIDESAETVCFKLFSCFFAQLLYMHTQLLQWGCYLLPSRILDPLRFQAGGRRRRPNLGLVCIWLMLAVFLIKDESLLCCRQFSFSLVMR